jgi:hypothetical protein
MISCTLTIRCYVFSGLSFDKTLSRTANGAIYDCEFPTVPRIGETVQLSTQDKGDVHDFTVKNVVYKMEEGTVNGIEIDLGAGTAQDDEMFDAGIARWRSYGFLVLENDNAP